jgi:hypothetical protein
MKATKKVEDDLKKIKWKTNQSTKINLIGCDTIVNSPSEPFYGQDGQDETLTLRTTSIFTALVYRPSYYCQAQL